MAWVCLKWNDTGHESYKWLVLCCSIGHAYRPHLAMIRLRMLELNMASLLSREGADPARLMNAVVRVVWFMTLYTFTGLSRQTKWIYASDIFALG